MWLSCGNSLNIIDFELIDLLENELINQKVNYSLHFNYIYKIQLIINGGKEGEDNCRRSIKFCNRTSSLYYN